MGVATVGHYASCRGCSPGTHAGVFPCCKPGSDATARVPCSRPGTRFGREGGNGNTLACVPCVPPNPDTKNLWERRRYVRLGLRRSDQFVDRPTSAVIMDAARQSGCCFPVDPPARISRIEPKTFLANERTFLNWLSMSVTLGSVASALVSFGKTTHSQVPSALPSMSGTTWPSHTPDSGIATVSLTAKRLERAYHTSWLVFSRAEAFGSLAKRPQRDQSASLEADPLLGMPPISRASYERMLPFHERGADTAATWPGWRAPDHELCSYHHSNYLLHLRQ